MDLSEHYLRWRERYGEGWGQAWFIGAAVTARFATRLGLTAIPLHRENIGWYGIRMDVAGGPIGRVTAGGHVERWTDGTSVRLELGGDKGDPGEMLQAAVHHLALADLPPQPRLARDAVVTEVLARLALAWPPHAFAVKPSRGFGAAGGPPATVDVTGPTQTVPVGGPDGLDLAAMHRAGALPADLAGDLAVRIGLHSPIGDSAGSYTLAEHRHRYAAWCAARAAGRGLSGATNQIQRLALEASSLPDLIAGPTHRWPADADKFDRAHQRWCGDIVAALHAEGVTDATHGRAAKLVAIYIKTLVVCGGWHHTGFARVAHPPIDRLLLQALAKESRFPAHLRSMWAQTSWTRLGIDGYDEVVASLREVMWQTGGFWRIERWWT